MDVREVAARLFVVGLLAATGACTKRALPAPADAGAEAETAATPAPPPPLGEVQLSYVAPPEVAQELPEAEVATLLRTKLLATRAFGTGSGEPYRGEALVICVLRPAGEGASLRAAVDIKLDTANAPKLQAKLVAEKPVTAALPAGPKRREALRAFIGLALEDAARLVAMQARMERAPTPALLAEIKSTDRDVRDQAVQILGIRRAVEAVPALLEALADTDPEVAQHAVGALVSVGDVRATPKIIALTKNRGGFFLIQLLYALGSLGGRDAEAFLWSISQGHPDPNARRAASEALSTLRRKAERSAAP